MKPLELKPLASLKDYQEYVIELEEQRGFSDQNALEKCLLLGEEMGELFKAIRKTIKLKMDVNSNTGPVKDELADIFIYVCAIANRFDINLEKICYLLAIQILEVNLTDQVDEGRRPHAWSLE